MHLIAFAGMQRTIAPMRMEYPILQVAVSQTGRAIAYVAAHVIHCFNFYTASDFHMTQPLHPCTLAERAFVTRCA